jgi:hypothetical protein
MKPTPLQVLAAQIRAAREAYEKANRKRCGGGWEVPSNKENYDHLAGIFGLTPVEVSYFFTYSRICHHTWKSGACHLCPVPAITLKGFEPKP